jgi:signal transduction histidine kinase/ActR/RegA family two-component response regulator
MTLRAKIAIPILLIGGLLIAFLVGYWAPAQLRETEEEVRDAAQRHLASAAEGFVPFLLARQLDALYENLDALRGRNADWRAIELTLPDGQLVYPLRARDDALRPRADERILRQPVRFGGAELATLAVKVDMGHRLAEVRRRHAQLVAASLLVTLAFVGAIWLLLERRVARPLASLAKASKRLAAGEYDTPLERSGAREVDALVESFAAMREAMRKYQSELLQAQKMEALGTLAGGIAHDFNNILSPIIAYAELAKEAAAGQPALEADLREIAAAAARARDLVRQILAFSRRSEGKKEPVDLGAVAREALRLLRASLPATVEIRQRLDGEARVLADPTQLHQVIMNLCTNAAHAMEPAGGVLAVSLDEVSSPAGAVPGVQLGAGRHALLTVSDTGAGMAPATLARIFDPYFTTKEKGKGTGLGLSVVAGIVRAHDGRIGVYSEPGAGTTFRVYLPLVGAPATAAVASAEAPAPTSRHERVLFVDDEEPIRAVTRRYLGDLGYRVHACANGKAALEALERDPGAWDLLVTDLTMPVMGGKELAARALTLRPDLPVILCSGHSSLIDADEAARLGVREYVEKPVAMPSLLRSVRRALQAPPEA